MKVSAMIKVSTMRANRRGDLLHTSDALCMTQGFWFELCITQACLFYHVPQERRPTSVHHHPQPRPWYNWGLPWRASWRECARVSSAHLRTMVIWEGFGKFDEEVCKCEFCTFKKISRLWGRLVGSVQEWALSAHLKHGCLRGLWRGSAHEWVCTLRNMVFKRALIRESARVSSVHLRNMVFKRASIRECARVMSVH
jgi:hypothetical protein